MVGEGYGSAGVSFSGASSGGVIFTFIFSLFFSFFSFAQFQPHPSPLVSHSLAAPFHSNNHHHYMGILPHVPMDPVSSVAQNDFVGFRGWHSERRRFYDFLTCAKCGVRGAQKACISCHASYHDSCGHECPPAHPFLSAAWAHQSTTI